MGCLLEAKGWLRGEPVDGGCRTKHRAADEEERDGFRVCKYLEMGLKFLRLMVMSYNYKYMYG